MNDELKRYLKENKLRFHPSLLEGEKDSNILLTKIMTYNAMNERYFDRQDLIKSFFPEFGNLIASYDAIFFGRKQLKINSKKSHSVKDTVILPNNKIAFIRKGHPVNIVDSLTGYQYDIEDNIDFLIPISETNNLFSTGDKIFTTNKEITIPKAVKNKNSIALFKDLIILPSTEHLLEIWRGNEIINFIEKADNGIIINVKMWNDDYILILLDTKLLNIYNLSKSTAVSWFMNIQEINFILPDMLIISNQDTIFIVNKELVISQTIKILAPISCILFDEDRLIISTQCRELKIWNLKDQYFEMEITLNIIIISMILYEENDLILGLYDGNLIKYNLLYKTFITLSTGYFTGITNLIKLPDGRIIIYSLSDQIEIWH